MGALMAERHLQSCVIVLDHADKLRDMPAPILPALLRLNQLVRMRACLRLLLTRRRRAVASEWCW